MDHYSIATSFKRIDKKFTEELSSAERQEAYHKFKKVYAEMAKLATQITKKQKIQENITQLGELETSKQREIDRELRLKMEKHSLNREKRQESLEKEMKMLDENWRNRMEEIGRKKRQREKEAARKAERQRRQDEQFWNKKKSLTSRDNREEHSESQAEAAFLQLPNSRTRQNTQFATAKTEEKKLRFLLPDLKKTKIKLKSGQNNTLSQSVVEANKSEDVRMHQQRTERKRVEREEANFQMIMQKLEKIEITRKVAQEKIQKQVKDAKKARQLRQSPEGHAANRQRSIEEFHSKSKKKVGSSRSRESLSVKGSLSVSRGRSKQSLEKHLQVKKRISENEFMNRESSYEVKKQKLKNGRINRLIREAINQIKQKSLNQRE